MAIPTISSVAPATVWTGGQMVTVTGTNFRLPSVPGPSSTKLPPPNPSVKVTAGGVDATNVRVLSATQLTCIVGAHDPGSVSLTVQNLDDNGAAIPGEAATRANAFTYARPDLAAKGDFDRLNRAFLRLLRQQVIDNVTQWVSTDYGEDGFDVATLGDLPALAVAGPQIDWATAVYQTKRRMEVGGYPATTYQTRRAPIKADVVYELFGFTDNQQHVTALEPLMLQFFDRNPDIYLPRDPADASKGQNKYQMLIPFGESIRSTTVANSSNIRAFQVSCRIRGFGIESIAGFPDENLIETGGVVDTIAVTSSRKA